MEWEFEVKRAQLYSIEESLPCRLYPYAKVSVVSLVLERAKEKSFRLCVFVKSLHWIPIQNLYLGLKVQYSRT
jgi:hypothetical protein